MDNHVIPNVLWQHVQPLSHPNINLNGVVWRDKIIIRGESTNKKFCSAIKKSIGLDIPQTCKYTHSTAENIRLSWLSPNEFMFCCPFESAKDWVLKLQESLKDIHSSVVDVSDYYRTITLSGDKRDALINKASPYNTDEFQLGMVIGTHYANATIHLWHLGTSYEIQVRYSFFPYLWQYLIDGAKEWLVE